MASVYTPSPLEIEATTAELREKHLERKRNEPQRAEQRGLVRERMRQRRKAERIAESGPSLNYFDNRSAFGPFKTTPTDGPREMTKADICNVSLIEDHELCDAMGMLLDCVGLQTRANDIAGRWTIGGIDPELFDVSDVPPLKSEHACVPFRSAK